MDKNKGFSFYENFWTAIESLPIDQQKEACYAIARYGITGEMVNAENSPIGYAMATAFKLAIDNSVENFNKKVENSVRGGRPKKINDEELKRRIMENSGETAQSLADYFGVSVSAIQKHEIWKKRKMYRAAASEF